jgi:pre-mRNA-processing factor 40
LNTSTYHKPMVLESQIQPAVSEPQEAHKTADASTTEASRVWTEYTDATTGKKYYSNGVTTTWEKPETFVSPAAIVARSVAAEEAESSSVHESARKKRKTKSNRETPFRNNEEAVAAFKGLLLAKGVSPNQKWNEVVKMCSTDARWDDCEAVLTTGERKQAMAEYQTKRANDLRDQERQERARAKDAFNLLLSEVLPKLPSFSVWKTRFSDIRDSISKDDRFYAVPNEEMRETLYLDFCEELRKHDERKKRNKKREAQEAFCSFLREKEEAGVLSFSSTW